MNLTLHPALRRLLVVSTLWVLAIAVISWCDWYFFSILERKTALFVEAKEAVALLEARRTSILRERARMNERAGDIQRIKSAFVNPEDPLPFIEKLERTARENGVRLTLTLPQKRTQTLVMRIEADGTRAKVLTFLKKTEGFVEQVIVEELALEALGEIARAREIPRAHLSGVIEFLAH